MAKKGAVIHKRDPGQKQQDLNFIAPLFIDGVSTFNIAKQLNEIRDYDVYPQLVYKDILHLIADWKKQRVKLIDGYKSIMIERAEKMWAIACENWELSKQGKTKTVQKQKNYPGTKKLNAKGEEVKAEDIILKEQQKHHTESIGDPVWYNAMMDAWKVLYDCLDLKNSGKKEDINPELNQPVEPVRDLVFITRTRRADYQDAIELPEDENNLSQNLLIS